MDFSTLRQILVDLGVTQLYAKVLAPNDNNRNQPYLGGDFSALNILPSSEPVPDLRAKRPNFKAKLNFYWIDDDGSYCPAPGAQLILYPKYPEVRLSGYLFGSQCAPRAVMGPTRQPGRVLFLGVRERDGAIFARAATPGSSLSKQIAHLKGAEPVGVFLRLSLALDGKISTRDRLLTELCRVHNLGWIESKSLTSDGRIRPCGTAPRCGGATLEAELGIALNSESKPDFLGWELKQVGVADFTNYRAKSLVTLMTPEPTGGIYKTDGFIPFLDRYGRERRISSGVRVTFNGMHRVGTLCKSSGLTLTLLGYDPASGKITDMSKGIALIDPASGEEAAVWGYARLMAQWNRKHATAAYVPAVKRLAPPSFKYAPKVRLAVGTDFLRFLAAVRNGTVVLDPGSNYETDGHSYNTSRRSQFRIKASDVSCLYESADWVPVCE